jgi:hypothetical protein
VDDDDDDDDGKRYGGNYTLLAKRLIARSSWFRSLPFWPLKTNEKQVDVSWQKRFSVSVVVQTETVFSFLRGRQRTAETVFSFRRCTDGNSFQFPASSAKNGGNGFQFPKDL